MPPKPSPDARLDELDDHDALGLVVNGQAQRAPAPCTIAMLLAQLELANRRVAVAVEREVIPRSSFDTHQLADGDRIEILEAVGGG